MVWVSRTDTLALLRSVVYVKVANQRLKQTQSCMLIKPQVKLFRVQLRVKLSLLFFLGMYMCSSCKHTGQWDQLAARLSLSKSKRSKTKEKIENDISELQTINESLEQIRTSTNELKMLDNEAFLSVLNKFKLPVSYVPKYLSLTIKYEIVLGYYKYVYRIFRYKDKWEEYLSVLPSRKCRKWNSGLSDITLIHSERNCGTKQYTMWGTLDRPPNSF